VVRWWAVESIGYLILYVRDVDVSAAFYRDVVGLPFKLRDAGVRGVRHTRNEVRAPGAHTSLRSDPP
jgi:catechol 2,3-dioxygenase-like lactoylglutathione lyase family enzyme